MKFTPVKVVALMATVLACASSAAQTKAPEPDFTLAYNVAAVSDYRFRGIAQTSKKPALQGGVDFNHKGGFYVGAWASNVKWVKDFNGATKGDLEVDLYGGFKGELAKGLNFDVGAITYRYPGNNSGAVGTPGFGGVTNVNTNELFGALTYSVFTAKYSRSTGNFLGFINSSGSSYLDLSAAIDLGSGMTLTPRLGRQLVAKNGAYNYTDFAVTLAKDFGNGVALSVAATATNADKGGVYTDFKNKFLAGNAVVLGAKYSF